MTAQHPLTSERLDLVLDGLGSVWGAMSDRWPDATTPPPRLYAAFAGG
ncbi:hypothetical protein AB0E63_32780 [Kribbella sp. NPDC026596]